VSHLPWGARFYWVLVVGAGIVCTALFLPRTSLTPRLVVLWLILAALEFLSEIYETELVAQRKTSTAMAICTAAIYIGGIPLGILTVLAGSLAAEILLRWSKRRQSLAKFFTYVGFNLAQLVVSVTVAGLVLQAAGGTPPPYTSWTQLLPLLAAFVAYIITNTSLVAGIIHLTEGARLGYLLRFDLRHLHVQLLTLGGLAILMAIVYPLSPWYVLLVGSPLMVVQISIRSYARLREQAKEAFQRIAQIVGQRDTYTGTHSQEVAELATRLARALRLPDEVVDRIRAAAQVHDLGKIAVPDRILLKPGKLSEEEWAVIKRHPVVGAEILKGLEVYAGVADVVRHEHEHWDGGGYPDGLRGEQIPLASRILAVADVWNALTTDRPYRKAFPPEEAREILRGMAGTVLDPKLVDVFLSTLR